MSSDKQIKFQSLKIERDYKGRINSSLKIGTGSGYGTDETVLQVAFTDEQTEHIIRAVSQQLVSAAEDQARYLAKAIEETYPSTESQPAQPDDH